MNVKTLVAALALAAAMTATAPRVHAEGTNPDPLNEKSILFDPDIPAQGNVKGDITIVEYFDYQCPYCKKVNPELMKVVREDGHVRLVFKDWPIFGDASVQAARLALAAKYQNKHAEAHDALISLTGRLTENAVERALVAAGIDLERAKTDLDNNHEAIDAILARNNEQASAFGFRGTPAFIIGHFRVPGALDAGSFKEAIAAARAAARKK